MTFLELVNRVSTLAGMQGRVTSTASNKSYQASLIELAKVAWEDIQTKRKDWYFLKADTSFYVEQGTNEYSVATALGATGQRFSHWDERRIYSEGNKLNGISEDAYYRAMYGSTGEGKPSLFSVNEADNTLSFNSVDQQYIIKAHYYKSAQVLSNDTDVPDLPNEYHNIIVYKTISELGSLIGTGNLIARYDQKYATMLGDLMRDQLPSLDLKRRSIV